MHIFIDESGTFVLATEPNSVSIVGALVVPDRLLVYIEKRYSKIRRDLPKENDEVKGRLLAEKEIDLVVSMLADQQVLFFANAIDLGTHSHEDIAWHKAEQENGITKNLTDDFSSEYKKEVFALRHRLEEMPFQLYVQSAVTFELIAHTLSHSTMYFSQRIPKELGKFNWVIDGKERDQVTDWEKWWSQVVKPSLQAKSLREPMPMFEEGNYRYFSRFDGKLPEHLKPHLKDKSGEVGTDIGKILSESFRFSSKPEYGLELVDILTNATRRALNGNLTKSGWGNIPRLMIHEGRHYIRMLALMKREPPDAPYPYMPVLRDFTKVGRNMLLPHYYQQ